ncbi:MAG: class I SAM-dependent methyltransferase [Actinomycetota bacterium]|nr:class I SAM-dependent methyltransferase [Actinomycetota bacterium]
MTRFDHDYYHRYYGPAGVHAPEQVGHLATAVHAMAAWWGVEIHSMLDVGAGLGMWRDWYRRHHPAVHTLSIDISEHACRTWGHEQRDITTWRPERSYDLVVCHSVLQYVADEGVATAVEHLADATECVLYLEAPTTADLAHVVDPQRTDMEVHHRSGEWYRALLGQWFQQVGAGLWVKRGTVPMFELEAAAP